MALNLGILTALSVEACSISSYNPQQFCKVQKITLLTFHPKLRVSSKLQNNEHYY